jgi:hypothetical protein
MITTAAEQYATLAAMLLRYCGCWVICRIDHQSGQQVAIKVIDLEEM